MLQDFRAELLPCKISTSENQLKSLTRKLRKNFEDDIAKDAKTAPKKFWSYVHSRTKTRTKIPILPRKDGTVAVTPLEKAETLNEFFSSVFTDENVENLSMREFLPQNG